MTCQFCGSKFLSASNMIRISGSFFFFFTTLRVLPWVVVDGTRNVVPGDRIGRCGDWISGRSSPRQHDVQGGIWTCRTHS